MEDTIITKAIVMMQELGFDDFVIWSAVCSIIAARDGITWEEASQNFANLLANVAAETTLEV